MMTDILLCLLLFVVGICLGRLWQAWTGWVREKVDEKTISALVEKLAEAEVNREEMENYAADLEIDNRRLVNEKLKAWDVPDVD